MTSLYPLGENWFKTYNLMEEPFIKEILKTAQKSNNNFLITETDYYKIVRFLEESKIQKKVT
jgi:hypothetical protein